MQAQEVGSADWQRLTTDTPVRSAVRFPVQLAIQIQSEFGDVDAVTEDVSANGLLFRGRSLPQVDSRIEFTMRMPGPVMGRVEDVLIYCVGRIVRHQVHANEDVAAAVIDEYFLKA